MSDGEDHLVYLPSQVCANGIVNVDKYRRQRGAGLIERVLQAEGNISLGKECKWVESGVVCCLVW